MHQKLEQHKLDLPAIPHTLTMFCQVEAKYIELEPKILQALSSPSHSKFESLERGRSQLLVEGEWAKKEAMVLHNQVIEFTSKRPKARKRVQKGGELTGAQARAIIKEKDQKEAQKAAKKEL